MHNFLKYETARCLQCFNAPCEQACPVHIPVPGFIRMIKSGNLIGAAEEIKSANTLANICGQICPEEIFCQSVCTRAQIDEPIAIRRLHDFATRFESEKGFSEPQMPTFPLDPVDVAVIGAGPAGLSCAFELRKMGIGCHLFDRFEKSGGVPAHIIPSWRITSASLDSDLQFLHQYLPSPHIVAGTVSFAELRKKYRATFIATGLWLDRWLEIPGEEMPDVYHAIDYLSLARSGVDRWAEYKNIIVIGGGNVSLDVAATAIKLGAEQVFLTYRRSPAEMKTWQAEKKAAEEAGVQFIYQLQPVEILGENNRVTGLRCVRTEMSEETDSSNRRIAVPVASSELEIPADAVVISVGQDSSVLFEPDIEQAANGVVRVDENFMTSVPGVFAGGDLVRGEGTVVQAVADGKKAARAIYDYLQIG